MSHSSHHLSRLEHVREQYRLQSITEGIVNFLRRNTSKPIHLFIRHGGLSHELQDECLSALGRGIVTKVGAAKTVVFCCSQELKHDCGESCIRAKRLYGWVLFSLCQHFSR